MLGSYWKQFWLFTTWRKFETAQQLDAYPSGILQGIIHLDRQTMDLMMDAAYIGRNLDAPVNVAGQTQDQMDQATTLRLHVVSHNVLTIRARAKKRVILEQHRKANVHILISQEARNETNLFSDGQWVHAYSSPDQDHSCGCAVHVNLQLPFSKVQGKFCKVRPQNVKMLHAEPRLLILAINVGAISFAVVSGHAPAQDKFWAKEWWEEATRTIINCVGDLPIVMGLDANTTRPDVWEHVHCGKPFPTNTKMLPLFDKFILDLALLVPMSQTCLLKNGCAVPNFIARGLRTYNSYILVTAHVATVEGSIYTLTNFDCASKADDHLPLELRCLIRAKGSFISEDRRKARYCRKSVKDPVKAAQFASFLEQCSVPPFAIEPTSHMHILQNDVQAAAQRAFPIEQRFRKLEFLSDDTMALIKQRGRLRKEFRHSGKNIANLGNSILTADTFLLWRWACVDPQVAVVTSTCSKHCILV